MDYIQALRLTFAACLDIWLYCNTLNILYSIVKQLYRLRQWIRHKF